MPETMGAAMGMRIIANREIRVVDGVAYVPLTHGYEAIIDCKDIDLIKEYNWCARFSGNTVYAVTHRNGKTIRMHRKIMGDSSKLSIDHIDGNGVNNSRSNLRYASYAENGRNSRIKKNNTSGFKGVSWHPQVKRWQSHIYVDGKSIYLGLFDEKIAAHEAYKEASLKYHGSFGRFE